MLFSYLGWSKQKYLETTHIWDDRRKGVVIALEWWVNMNHEEKEGAIQVTQPPGTSKDE